MSNKVDKKVTEYNLTFIGATSNQAQAIQGVIQSINDLKSRDELPMKKYQSEIDDFKIDLKLFKDIKEKLDKSEKSLIKRVQDRIEHYENEISEREMKIKNHQENIDYINNYIKKIQSHITEKVDHYNHMVEYTYDMTYLDGLLDLALIVFELDFDDEKKQHNSNVS